MEYVKADEDQEHTPTFIATWVTQASPIIMEYIKADEGEEHIPAYIVTRVTQSIQS